MIEHLTSCLVLLALTTGILAAQGGASKVKEVTAFHSQEKAIRDQSFALLKKGLAKAIRESPKGAPDVDAIAAGLLLNHRIVGLGEATHGTSEIFSMRTEFIKGLVRQGARALVLEVPVTRAYFLDDYVGHRAPANATILAIMKQAHFYRVWQVPEVAAMFDWIREFNADHAGDPVRIYGMDPQLADFEKVIQMLDGKAPGFDAASARAKEAAYFEANDKRFENVDPAVKVVPGLEAHQSFEDRAMDILALRKAMAAPTLRSEDRNTVERHLRAAEQSAMDDKLLTVHLARLFPTFLDIFHFDAEGNVRDQHMAENFLLLDKLVLQGKGKVILWAHSGHLTRRKLSVPSTGANFIPVGSLIAQQYGDQYHVIHFTTYGGSTRAYPVEWPSPKDRLQPVSFTCPEGSMESLIRSAGAKAPIFIQTKGLPMRDLKVWFLGIGSTHVDKGLDGFFEGSFRSFDSVFFLPEGHASKDLVDPVRP